MGGWVRYLKLQAKAKTGLSVGLLVFAIIALLALALAIGFLILACFIWLAARYDALTAALILCGGFFLIAIIAALCCLIMRRSAVTHARLALAERKQTPWLNTSMLATGLEVGRALGWGRLVSIGAAAVLAAGIGREWFGHEDSRKQDADDDAASSSKAS
jgi:uncharacterized membrane protein YedE/YeeE